MRTISYFFNVAFFLAFGIVNVALGSSQLESLLKIPTIADEMVLAKAPESFDMAKVWVHHRLLQIVGASLIAPESKANRQYHIDLSIDLIEAYRNVLQGIKTNTELDITEFKIINTLEDLKKFRNSYFRGETDPEREVIELSKALKAGPPQTPVDIYGTAIPRRVIVRTQNPEVRLALAKMFGYHIKGVPTFQKTGYGRFDYRVTTKDEIRDTQIPVWRPLLKFPIFQKMKFKNVPFLSGVVDRIALPKDMPREFDIISFLLSTESGSDLIFQKIKEARNTSIEEKFGDLEITLRNALLDVNIYIDRWMKTFELPPAQAERLNIFKAIIFAMTGDFSMKERVRTALALFSEPDRMEIVEVGKRLFKTLGPMLGKTTQSRDSFLPDIVNQMKKDLEQDQTPSSRRYIRESVAGLEERSGFKVKWIDIENPRAATMGETYHAVVVTPQGEEKHVALRFNKDGLQNEMEKEPDRIIAIVDALKDFKISDANPHLKDLQKIVKKVPALLGDSVREIRNEFDISVGAANQAESLGKYSLQKTVYDQISVPTHVKIRVPEVYFSSPYEMISEWLPGDNIDQAIAKYRTRIRVGLPVLMEDWLVRILGEDGKFHKDLHPGNMSFRFNEKTQELDIILYDFAMMGNLYGGEKYRYMILAFALYQEDFNSAARILYQISTSANEKSESSQPMAEKNQSIENADKTFLAGILAKELKEASEAKKDRGLPSFNILDALFLAEEETNQRPALEFSRELLSLARVARQMIANYELVGVPIAVDSMVMDLLANNIKLTTKVTKDLVKNTSLSDLKIFKGVFYSGLKLFSPASIAGLYQYLVPSYIESPTDHQVVLPSHEKTEPLSRWERMKRWIK